MCEICADLVEVLNEISDSDGSDELHLKKEHALKIFAYINSWTQRQCLCCFKEYKHLEIFNQVVCALINLVISQVQALRDQLMKICTTSPDKNWQDETNPSEELLNVEKEPQEEEGEEGKSPPCKAPEKPLETAKTCNLTEEDPLKSTDPFSLWSTDEKEKLLLCVAKIFQIQFPLYTAYKHNTHPTIEVCVPWSVL